MRLLPLTRARLGAAVRHPVAAVLAVVLLLTGATVAAARDWVQIFRTEQVATLDLSTTDLLALPDLGAYGELELTGDPDLHEVPDASVAAARTGLHVPEVTTLPTGVIGDPVYHVGGTVHATFTFSAQRAEQAAAGTGHTVPAPPPGLDGSQLRMSAGPGVAQTWSSSAGVPALVVGRGVAPTVFSSSGVPFETARDHLLSLPGLPEDVAVGLRSLTADGSTLPLPVPADRVTTSTTDVNGIPATVLTTGDRTMSAVVWVHQGTVTVVAGSVDADEVLTVARSLE